MSTNAGDKKNELLQRLWYSSTQNKTKGADKNKGSLISTQLNPDYFNPVVELANHHKTRIEFHAIAANKSAKFHPIDVTYSESFTSEWNHASVYGRNDPLSTFSGTKRNISLEFKIVPWTQEEAIASSIEVSMLMAMMYPTYKTLEEGPSNASQIESSPLMKVHFNNLLLDPSVPSESSGRNARASQVGLVCAVNDLTVTPDFEAGVLHMSSNNGPRFIGDGDQGKGAWKMGHNHSPGAGGKLGSVHRWPTHHALDGHTTFYPHRASKWLRESAVPLSIKDSRLYPKMWTVSVSLVVFHTFPLGFRKGGDTYYGSKGFASFPYGEKHTYTAVEAKAINPKGKRPSSADMSNAERRRKKRESLWRKQIKG